MRRVLVGRLGFRQLMLQQVPGGERESVSRRGGAGASGPVGRRRTRGERAGTAAAMTDVR
jgi:hypothetical protein